MSSAHHGAPAGRGFLLRLVAVVAVLVGVMVLQGPRCSDGMIAAMASGTHGANLATWGITGQDCGLAMAMAAVITPPQHTAARCAADHSPSGRARVAGHSSGLGDPGGVLGSCLVLVVTVLAAMAGLSPRWLRSFRRLCARGRGTRVGPVGLRAVNLTQLCLLRT